MRLAASRTFCTAGSSRPIRTAMIAITIKSSISVKPRRRAVITNRGIAAPLSLGETAAVGRRFNPSGRLGNRPTKDSLTIRDLAQLRQVPDFHRCVAAAGIQALAVGAERQAADDSGVAGEGEDQFSGPAVPDLDLAVLTAGGDPPALVGGAERHRVDLLAVSPEGLKLPAGL